MSRSIFLALLLNVATAWFDFDEDDEDATPDELCFIQRQATINKVDTQTGEVCPKKTLKNHENAAFVFVFSRYFKVLIFNIWY